MAGENKLDKVKNAGIDFALVRISYGLTYMDKTYAYNRPRQSWQVFLWEPMCSVLRPIQKQP